MLASLLLLVVLLLHCSSSILGRPENKVTGHEADCVGYLACGRATWLGASWSSDVSQTSTDAAPGKSFSSSGGGVAYDCSITADGASGCCIGNIVLATVGGCITCWGENTALAGFGTEGFNPAVPCPQPAGLPEVRILNSS